MSGPAYIAFQSPREALGYMYARRSGPGMARFKWHDAPTGAKYCEAAAHVMGAVVYGLLRVKPGSAIDRELQEWATDSSVPRSPRVFALYKRILRTMKEHDLLARHEVRSLRTTRDALERLVSELETQDGAVLRMLWEAGQVESASGEAKPRELRTVRTV